MQAKVQKEFTMILGTNVEVKEDTLFRMAVEMEEYLNSHFPRYRVHINAKEQE